MNLEEYKSALNDIEKEAKAKKQQLYKDYAKANNPYKEGDIITDHIGSIRIEKITAVMDANNIPVCWYDGKVIKKDGTPTKRGAKRSIYQHNIDRIGNVKINPF